VENGGIVAYLRTQVIQNSTLDIKFTFPNNQTVMVKKVISLLIAICVLFALTGCNPPESDDFGLIFAYGVTAGNVLNTFEGTYTKDMVLDPPITVSLPLTEEELDAIYQKMIEIDFFNYPDEFSITVPPDEGVGIVTPSSCYYFKVIYDSKIKELRWEDKITNPDTKAEQLRELIELIISIVQSKKEYQRLPTPKSGYM